ncbi:MAG: tRNA preQ1(34) S-adenosylmethionine ribosyltransferase-isomerase QueA [Pseudomonadota bacterium]
MRVDAFDFTLPEDLIALRPAEPREAARLLHVKPPARFTDHRVANLPGFLRSGDVLVLNDTRVIPARLFGERVGRGEGTPSIEVTLHKREGGTHWRAFAKPGRKLIVGDRIRFEGASAQLDASVEDKGEGGEIRLAFDGDAADFDQALASLGEMPLPPYIASRRAVDAQDEADYQTVYAEKPGAVAAPTAGLHLTDELLHEIAAKGVHVERVTLHVGAGTFLPVKADDTENHRMHAEWGEISASTAQQINSARAAGNRCVAMGTTAMRILETAAKDGAVAPFSGDTDIFITPGYRFQSVDALITNFHLPKSTLFMLVSAFCGLETMQAAYAHAITEGYRFYSYGDASFLERAE